MNKYYFLVLLFFLFWGNLEAQQSIREFNELFNNNQNNGEVYFRIQNQDININKLSSLVSLTRHVETEWVYAYANKKQFLALVSENLEVEMLPHPGTLIHPKMKSDVNIKNLEEWDFYPTYDAYISMMYQFESLYPDLCRIEVIGQSTNGRDLLACVISDNGQLEPGESQFLYTSSMHGNELAGYPLMLRLIDYLLTNYGSLDQVTEMVNNLEIWINPLANPDGTYAGGNNSVFGATRYNANGTDLNRNFSGPEFTPEEYEVETLAFMDLANNYQFSMSANIHGGEEVCNYPWDYTFELHPKDEWWQMVCHEYADTAQFYSPPGYMENFDDGIVNGAVWYVISGGRQDYMNHFHDCLEFTLEISDEYILPESQLENWWQYNYRSLLNYMHQAIPLGQVEIKSLASLIDISPNPGNGIYKITYTGQEVKRLTATVMDQMGKIVKTFDLSLGLDDFEYVMDIQSFKDGVYILNLKGDQLNISRKIIKE